MRAAIRLLSLCCLVFLNVFIGNVHAGLLTPLTKKISPSMSTASRYEKLPLFNPHRKSFTCVYQDQYVPPIDPQAELRFQRALALDDPDIYYKKRDYPRIYQLYQQAAERNHWKAMLNLASLILSSYSVPQHDPEVAIQWVERAMRLGVPDAYDMMGIYHQNGLVKGANATTAYAFFQRAADMGSPSAMTFLGRKLRGTYDAPNGSFWGNEAIAIEMLQCAYAQGYGDGAYELALVQSSDYSIEAKAQALKTFHEGVKLGSAKCANTLSVEFDGLGLTSGRNLVGYIDKARAERYSKIGDALEHYQGRLKLPNLDKILPLPPAPLPKWDGDEDTLINAAKAVTPPPEPSRSSQLKGREAMPDGHGVRPWQESLYAVDGTQPVPESGYWLAMYIKRASSQTQRFFARTAHPEFYKVNERFEPARADWLTAAEVQWHFLGEARPLAPQREVFLKLMIDAGWVRQIASVLTPMQCNGFEKCPETGIWEGRVSTDHPLAGLYNQWNRQAFVEAGEAFPDPRQQHLDIAMGDVRWTWLGGPNALRMPGVYDIAL